MRDIFNRIKAGIIIFDDAFSKIVFANQQALNVLFNPECPVLALRDQKFELQDLLKGINSKIQSFKTVHDIEQIEINKITGQKLKSQISFTNFLEKLCEKNQLQGRVPAGGEMEKQHKIDFHSV